MVSHCANPECGNEFLYLRDGELFVIKSQQQPSAHYYWLCSSCASHLRIINDPSHGVLISPRPATTELDGGTVAAAIRKAPKSDVEDDASRQMRA